MLHAFNILSGKLKLLLFFYIIIQIIFVLNSSLGYQSDSAYYYKLAQETIEANSIYPIPRHLYEDYISAPLFINILATALSIFNSKITIALMNILLNVIQLLLVVNITDKLFGKNAALISVILYMIYLNNIGLVLLNLTEFLFGVLILSSLIFYLKENKSSLFISGLFAGASIAVRPTGWLLVAAYIIIFFIMTANKQNKLKEAFVMVWGTLCFILIFGFITYLHFGNFIYTSTIGSINLLMGANENANGGYVNISKEGYASYIENSDSKTYYEKNKIWQDRAIEWILENPIKWIQLIPLKTMHLLAWDDIALSPLLNSYDWNFYKAIKYYSTGGKLFSPYPGKDISYTLSFIILQLVHHVIYFAIFFFGVKGIINLKEKFSLHNLPIILFITIGIGMHMLVIGDARYKYPFLLVIIPFASICIYNLAVIRKGNIETFFNLVGIEMSGIKV
jgi:hypothetical protein